MEDFPTLQRGREEIERLISTLPSEIRNPSYWKATKALFAVVFFLFLGYISLTLSPWFMLPVCWIIAGSAITGLAKIAYDCRNGTFVPSRTVNEVVGTACLIPLWLPFQQWKVFENPTTSKLSSSRFWFATSLWEWIKLNFTPHLHQKRMVFNIVLVYAFVMIFFPLLSFSLGWWGVLKYYVVPMLVFHFWMSTFHKASVAYSSILPSSQSVSEALDLYIYPWWTQCQLIVGNQNVPVPSYNLPAAFKNLRVTSPTTVDMFKLLFKAAKPSPMFMRIHGMWVDVGAFAEHHPGGPIAIQLGKNRDATALFEAHHPFTAKKTLDFLLAKYRVDESLVPSEVWKQMDPRERGNNNNNKQDLNSNSRGQNETELLYDWDDPKGLAFAQDVKQAVREYFEKEAERRNITLLQATKATPWRWAEMLGFSALFLAQVPFFVQGYWITIITVPVTAWVYAAASAHDAMHFAVSTDWRINWLFSYNCPWTTSPLMWYTQHVIGHHAYPNIPFRDPDLAHAPALIRLHPSIRWKPLHRFQRISTGLVWTLGATLYMTMVPLKALYFGVLNKAVYLSNLPLHRAIIHVTGRILTSIILWGWQWYVFQGDLPRQILFTVLPMLVHSLVFMVSTQVNHLTPENIERSDKNYYRHQVVTSHSFAMDSLLVFWLTGGLNCQIEHHLFPTVNHCHLPKLQSIVLEKCRKHDVPYHYSEGLGIALQKYWLHLTEMEKNDRMKSNGSK